MKNVSAINAGLRVARGLKCIHSPKLKIHLNTCWNCEVCGYPCDYD